MLEYIILGTLCNKEYSGYDIKKCIENGVGMFYKASYGSIYPLLNKLMELKLISCKEETSGNRNKKIYSITQLGREEFEKWLFDNSKIGSKIEDFVAKVFFFDMIPKDRACESVDLYEKSLITYLGKLNNLKSIYENDNNINNYYYKLSTLYFGICKLESMIMWCKTVKKRETFDKQ